MMTRHSKDSVHSLAFLCNHFFNQLTDGWMLELRYYTISTER